MKALISMSLVAVACGLTACGGSSDPISAKSCFDGSIYSPTSEVKHDYDEVTGTGLMGSYSATIKGSDGTAAFNGQTNLNTLEVYRGRIDAVPISGIGNSTTSHYVRMSPNGDIVNYGYKILAGSGLATTRIESTFSPPITDRKYTLEESESFQYTTTETRTQRQVSSQQTNTTSTPLSATIAFVGIETISIGPRSVEACRFTNNGSQEWFYRGILVQSSDTNGKTTRQTRSLTRDNQAF